jgi:hypothetical protein
VDQDEIDRERAERGLLPLDDPNEPGGRWTVTLTVKRRGIRGHQIMHWPPLDSAMRPTGLEWGRCLRWLERRVRDLAGIEGRVIRVEIDPVSFNIPARDTTEEQA